MAKVAITQEQCLLLEQSTRFQNVSKQFIRDIATFLSGQDGTSGNTGGRTPSLWARVRFIGAGFLFHPNSQNYQEWVSQFTMALKGQVVWENTGTPEEQLDTTITDMISSGKFDELANIVYDRRASIIEF
jgi:hypothetical protein